MNRTRWITTIALALTCTLAATVGQAADYRVEPLAEPAPADQLSDEIAQTLAPQGLRVIRGESRVVCDIWLCKQWEVPQFEAAGDVFYPFRVGQLIGVVRFERRAEDFRAQRIEAGVYTLRYAQQPVDGSHVGTSPTRDFLLMLPAKADAKPAAPSYEDLTAASAKAAQTTHPAMWSLQRAGDAEAGTIRNREDHDWWILTLSGKAVVGDASQPMKMDLVVVGEAVAA
jgi:hypothetical protein